MFRLSRKAIIFNEYHFKNDVFSQNNILNKKYDTKYQILINSIKKNNIIIYDVYIYYNNAKFFVSKIFMIDTSGWLHFQPPMCS